MITNVLTVGFQELHVMQQESVSLLDGVRLHQDSWLFASVQNVAPNFVSILT
jgi:hypothetical protein